MKIIYNILVKENEKDEKKKHKPQANNNLSK